MLFYNDKPFDGGVKPRSIILLEGCQVSNVSVVWNGVEIAGVRSCADVLCNGGERVRGGDPWSGMKRWRGIIDAGVMMWYVRMNGAYRGGDDMVWNGGWMGLKYGLMLWYEDVWGLLTWWQCTDWCCGMKGWMGISEGVTMLCEMVDGAYIRSDVVVWKDGWGFPRGWRCGVKWWMRLSYGLIMWYKWTDGAYRRGNDVVWNVGWGYIRIDDVVWNNMGLTNRVSMWFERVAGLTNKLMMWYDRMYLVYWRDDDVVLRHFLVFLHVGVVLCAIFYPSCNFRGITCVNLMLLTKN